MFYKNKYLKLKAELEILQRRDTFNVHKFNLWFCDNSKDRHIYAHQGIYLRTDKLGIDQIEHYVIFMSKLKGTTLTDEEILDVVQNNEYLFNRFENDISDDWRKQQNL